MTVASRIARTVAFTGLVLVCLATFLRAWPLRGWAETAGYLMMGLTLLSGRLAAPRRLALAFGAWFLIVAANSGLTRAWITHPPILDGAIIVLMTCGLLWIIIEAWRSRLLVSAGA
jgi:hypothetical protein